MYKRIFTIVRAGQPERVAAWFMAVTFILLTLGAWQLCFAASLEPVNGGTEPAGVFAAPEAASFQGPLKVATLNTAHGRKTAFHQVFLSQKTIRQNLTDIGRALRTAAVDIVALQETDGPSWWSGNFDHVGFLADQTGLRFYSRAGHMDRWALHYGTGLLARAPYRETRARRFKAAPLTPAKGFLLARFAWYPWGTAGHKPVSVDVISVHLDFSREKVRAWQIAEMQVALAGRNNPLIIMGDFNSDGLADDSVVRVLARQSGLQLYRPEATDLGTYGTRRLDWILISDRLAFLNYRVIHTVLSDHLAVVAEVGMKP